MSDREREVVHVLCDNGTVMPHDLPLPSGVADRVARGQLRLVNADGTPLDDGRGSGTSSAAASPAPSADPAPPARPAPPRRP